jgi:hypothetical protein
MVFSFLISFISDGPADLRNTAKLLKPLAHPAGLRENCRGWRSQPLPVKLQPAKMANVPRIQEVFFWCAWRRDEKRHFETSVSLTALAYPAITVRQSFWSTHCRLFYISQMLFSKGINLKI